MVRKRKKHVSTLKPWDPTNLVDVMEPNEMSSDRLYNILERAFAKHPQDFDNADVTYAKTRICGWFVEYEVKINWSDDTLTIDWISFPEFVTIKVPYIPPYVEGTEDVILEMIRDNSKAEVEFFKFLNNQKIPGCPIPHCYLAEAVSDDGEFPPTTGCLVLQVYGKWEKLITPLNTLPPYDIDELPKIMHKIAAFHHFFLTLPDQSWKDRFNTPPQMEDIMMDVNQFALIRNFGMDDKVDWLEPIFKPEHTVKGRNSYEGGTSEQDILEGLPSVLVHGNMASYYILWDKGIGTQPQESDAISDFSKVFTGGIAEDLVIAISLGMNKDERVNDRRMLLEYHNHLKGMFRDKGFRIPFTYDQLLDEYKRVYVYAAKQALKILCDFFSQAFVLEYSPTSDFWFRHFFIGTRLVSGTPKAKKEREAADHVPGSSPGDPYLLSLGRKAQGVIEDVLMIHPNLVPKKYKNLKGRYIKDPNSEMKRLL